MTTDNTTFCLATAEIMDSVEKIALKWLVLLLLHIVHVQ